jgi:alkylation response protein AidB-like acyl-CoA dehydrogenase
MKEAIDFELTPEQLRLKTEAREFANAVVRETAEQRSRDETWDPDLWLRMGERRWPGVLVPTEFGGMGTGVMEHAILVEEISRVDASLGAALNLLQQTVMAVLAFATPAQKAHYLPLLASGQSYSMTGITESDSGSRMEDMQTRALRKGEGWVINGQKTEVHIPEQAQICLVFAKTSAGISAFLMDTANPGFRVLGPRSTVGLRGLPMAAVAFEDCRVTADALLGSEGGAYDVFFKSFDLTRIGNAAKCIGIAAGALDEAVQYASRRRVGNNVVTDFQGLRWQLADLDTRIQGAKALMRTATREYQATGRSTASSARAKLLASTTAMDAATVALQITGSHGCFTDFPFARYLMDAKVSQITGGTIEILRNTIARELLGKTSAPTP